MKSYLQALLQGKTLSVEEAEGMFDLLLTGQSSAAETAAALAAMAARGEIEGAVRSLREKSVRISAPDNVVDCCGTGGDHAHTVNISTAVAFVLAACGVPVAKHGNRASSSKSGAADVLEALGLNLEADQKTVQNSMNDLNICFLMAPLYNPAIAHVMPVRREIKARTIFNLLGPLLNPAGAKRQLIGVYDAARARPMAEVLDHLGTEKAWVVWGHDGLDEISTVAKTGVVALEHGKILTFEIDPADYGLKCDDASQLTGDDAVYNAKALMGVLNGEPSAYRDIVCLNAAAALIVADHAEDLEQGIKMAQDALDQGKALNKLNALVEAYRG